MKQHAIRPKFGTTWSPDCFDGETAFKNMQDAFQAAMTGYPGELHESVYIFAGHTARIRVIGRDLAKHIYRPFSHLKTKGPSFAPPELRIDLWDENLTGKGGSIGPTNNGGGWSETTVKSFNDQFVGQQLPNTVSCLDRRAKHIVASIAWHDRIFIYEQAKPLARLLLEWHNDRGVQVIHAGLVARNGTGILFVGKSGSGKSTSSLACIAAGFDYLSEDYVGLEACTDGSFLGHSLYSSVFVQTSQLARFEELIPYAIKGRLPHEEKSVIILSEIFPERLRRSVLIRALVLLRVLDRPELRPRPASKGEALLALGPSSLLQIPNRELGANGFKRLVELVERVPCYWLDVGCGLGSVAPGVEEILFQVSPA